jgi:sodium-independent sulfate anion transporter 11
VGETEKAPPPRQQPEEQQLPRVRAIVLDCTTDNNIDITSVQGLVDARNALDRYACGCGGACVEWHFAGLSNRWARRALAVAGFGVPAGPPKTAGPAERPGAPTREGEENPLAGWEPIYVVATSLAGATAEDVKKARARKRYARSTEEEGRSQEGSAEKRREMATVHGVDRPFFHVDLTEAVDAAVRDARRMEEREKMNMGCR